jgi:hypothetical protein
MFASVSQVFSVTPLVQYVGDPETGLVHHASTACTLLDNESFLDLRTAIVRGYRMCPCCGGRGQ